MAIPPVRRLAAHLLPDLCPLCRLTSESATGLCAACRDALPRPNLQCRHCALPLPAAGLCPECLADPPPFVRVVCPCLYAAPLDRLVLALKRGDPGTAPALASVLADHLRDLDGDDANRPDALVPVPLHWRRRFGRGFNQARELARELGRELDCRVAPGLLQRRVNTPSQRGLSRRQRHRNLRRAFAVRRPVAGMHLAVVDDVVTTASTARAAATVLANAGAAHVEIWCVARTAVENRVAGPDNGGGPSTP